MGNTNAFDNFMNQPKRSQFLTTLCILSFIMCGIAILMGAFNIYQAQPEVMQKTIEQVRTVDAAMADQMENQFIASQNNSFMKVYPYLNIVFVLLSFLGVMMMWNFKRTGFYIYSIAEILPYTSLLFMDKGSMAMPGVPQGAVMAGTIAMIAIDLVFVFLYSRNLNEMNK